jgi:prepilin-type N-terminal cleavage/methylation domain-containing protein
MTMESDRSAAGFTLIEVLAALMIASIGLWIALPLLTGSSKARVLQDATSTFVTKLDQTRSRAMTTGKPASFLVDAASRSYQTDDGIATTLPRGMLIDASNGPSLIVFRPDGTATEATFDLRNGRAGARIGIDWLTGRATVAFDR